MTGAAWFRGPVKYETRTEAEHAAGKITVAPTMVKTTREIETVGLPEGPPQPAPRGTPPGGVRR